jgi:DHA1 family bicyclomycin/chloramphenicol resistance-like MFS transporter
MNRREHTILILVLGSLTAVGPFSIDMYLPGFPAIAQDLGTDISHVALTLTSYFIGISAGQLGYGPLLDRYGRKKPVVAGLLLYIVAAIGCGLAPSIHWLIGLRFLLALGSCVGIVAARAVVRDLFPIREIPRIFSTLMLVLGVSPIIAPSVGAYVAAAYGWRGIFAVLALIAVLILTAVIRYLPESSPGDRSVSLRPARMASNYLKLFREPMFVSYGLASAAASAGLFSYISDSPFVFMKLHGFSEREFGLIFGLSACGVIGASQLNRFWLRTKTSREISLTAVIGQCLVAVLLIVAALVGLPAVVVIVLVFCYLAGLGSLSPNTTAIALEPFATNAGTASALLGSMQMAGGAAGSALVSSLHNGTALPMTSLLLAASMISLSLQLWYRRIGTLTPAPGSK